jgi:hypothetical protein
VASKPRTKQAKFGLVSEKHELASYGNKLEVKWLSKEKEKYIKPKVEKASTNNPAFGWSCTMSDLE